MVHHCLFHLTEFTKAWIPGVHDQLSFRMIDVSGGSPRVSGSLLILTAVMFLTATIAYFMRREWYWIPATAALLLSQVLIVIYWQDAKYATFINVLLLVAVIHSAAAMHFTKASTRASQRLLAHATSSERLVTEDMIVSLPQNVQRWLRQSNVVGRPTPVKIKILQEGTLRAKPDGRWMSFRATQYFTIDPPGFVWIARIKAAPLIEIGGRDRYTNGKGNMVIKPLYLFRAADTSGSEIDQGTLIRYLAEMAWFPQAAVSEYLHWESINDWQARVTMDYADVSASCVYTFNEKGNVATIEARRYGEFDGVFRRETWSVAATGYGVFNNICIPNSNEVTWKLSEGDFKWLKLKVTDVIPQA